MARRKRREEQDDNVALDGPDHAWWAAASIDPFAHPPEPEAEPAVKPEAPAGPDPYVVLRVSSGAEWGDIVAAHRRLARWWHPDGLGDVSAEERSYSEARFREVNAAYQDLKVRKSR
jgi:DnaJ domain